MDSAAMVKDQIAGGSEFITELLSRGLELSAVCWAKLPDRSRWRLCLVVPAIEGQDVRPAYLTVRQTLRDMESKWRNPFERVDPFAVMVFAPSEPLAQGLLKQYHANPRSIGDWREESMVGDVFVEGVYIYSPTMFQPLPTA